VFDLQCFILLYNICVCHLFNKEISSSKTSTLFIGLFIGCAINSINTTTTTRPHPIISTESDRNRNLKGRVSVKDSPKYYVLFI